MPAKSKAQQMAAGIAHSVAKGEKPKSALRGASKQMFQSMSDTKIKKFAHTKRKGLPKRVSEGAEAAIDAKVQHFIKTMQNMPGQMGDEWLQSTMQEIEGLAQGQNNPEIQKYYPGWQPADFQKLYNRVMMHFYGGGGMGESRRMTARQMFEGRDDAPKLGLGKTGLKFARMTSKEAFKTSGGTDEKWKTSAKLRSELAGEKPGTPMKSMDKVGKVPSAIKDSRAAQVVAALLND